MGLTVTDTQNIGQNQLYNITPAANSTTVPNYNAVKKGGPLTNAIENGAKATYNFVQEHADPVEDAVKAAYRFGKYSSEHDLTDFYEGLEALAEMGESIGIDLLK
ncbi:hypothetical protein [Athalassotoga saccharophila]|uniref:Uncharacterized protein n=1 Tax=Athalassotoga saccharophila TaxID=1441386 RepID=A0A6N4TG12_9BACT|nr:hypothetical protein [Athalassotoga saccharophila]BBJ29102.1 hypothetical protein ATHSA_p20012 [Athalassotoga saccharophila]